MVTTKYTKIVTEAYISKLLEFNYVAQFDTCCTDGDKVTVNFVACSYDILIGRSEFQQETGANFKF